LQKSSSNETFTLQNQAEANQFNELLKEYVRQKQGMGLKHTFLPKAYRQLKQQKDGQRLIAAILDLHINWALLSCDNMEVISASNEKFAKGRLEGGSVFDSKAKFIGRMHLHRYRSSFIFRYRAFWDKIMGIMVLHLKPEEYNRFRNAKSRRNQFLRIAKETTDVPWEIVETVDQHLKTFEHTFRTPEAHDTGALRKWSFLMQPLHENPQIDLYWYWNGTVKAMTSLAKIFSEEEKDNVSDD
jgi:hypothetical protein